jgi:hypothetical protein
MDLILVHLSLETLEFGETVLESSVGRDHAEGGSAVGLPMDISPGTFARASVLIEICDCLD